MSKRRGPVTAQEYLEEKMKDPEYVAWLEECERELALNQLKSSQEQAVLLAELANVGWHVNCVWDLVNMREPYPEAFPVLLKHMEYDYEPGIKEGIVRAMTIAPARAHWSHFVKAYKNEQHKRVKDALANLVSWIMDKSRIEEAIALILDSDNGTSRGFFLAPLARFKHPDILPALESLTTDSYFGEEAQRAVKAHKNRYYKKRQ